MMDVLLRIQIKNLASLRRRHSLRLAGGFEMGFKMAIDNLDKILTTLK